MLLQKCKQKLSRFRSEIHMSRYEKAIKQGQNILNMLQEIQLAGIQQKMCQQLKEHVLQQIKLVKNLVQMIDYHADGEGIKYEKGGQRDREHVEKIEQKWQRQQAVSFQPVTTSKWNKQKPAKIGKWQKKLSTKSPQKSQIHQPSNYPHSHPLSQSSPHIFLVPTSTQPTPQIKLQQDQLQILQRQTILPLNLPDFFKGKQCCRLLVCYYQKCQHIVKLFRQSIVRKVSVVELEELEKWVPAGKSDGIRVYITAFGVGQEKIIRDILRQQNNMLVLYSDINRQLLAQKPSTIYSQSFTLCF